MGTKQDCQLGEHTADNQGLCWWCGTVVEPEWYAAYTGERHDGMTMTETKTEVKSRPILFSGPMVRAILEGRKTQTRRTVKLADSWDVFPNYAGECWPVRKRGNELQRMRCPYGQVGDRLWVRETWMPFDEDHRIGECWHAYRADTTEEGEEIRKEYIRAGYKYQWRPSIHMPRWASRITLKIFDIRVERLQSISNDDCVAEGITANGKGVRMSDGSYAQAGRFEAKSSTVRQLYSELWETINGPGSWSANPWVWVVSFRRVEQ